MDDSMIPQVKIERPLYEQEQLQKVFEYENEKKSALKSLLNGCSKCKPAKFVKKTFPILEWLPKYNWKQDFSSDLISGFTVAVMHIPQGMAYAMLGNVPPIIGLYMAFFPVLIYCIFGTSKHNSMGTFAIICLLTGNVVLKHSSPNGNKTNLDLKTNSSGSSVDSVPVEEVYTIMQIITTLSLVVGLYQVVMYVFRLGILSALLSETLVSGFTTGAAFCVLISQFKDLLGISIPNHIGYFVNIKTLTSIFEEIGNTNYISCIISALTIIILTVNNHLVKPYWSKRVPVPIPIELIVVLAGTFASKYFFLNEEHGVKIVGNIPSGIPSPQLPPMSLVPKLMVEGFTVAIVSYTITLSMALIFAQKLQYKVDANQELLAMGLGNSFGAFFSCMPFCASLSRSLVQQTVGGKTQLTSIVSCSILVFILLWIGPFFEPLPKGVLASIIVVALTGMLKQVTAFPDFYKLSKLDAIVWMITFLIVVFIGIDIGLFVGILLSLLSIFVLGFRPYTCLLGNIPRTDYYLDINKFKAARELPHIKIFHYQGAINFATKAFFRSELCRLIEFEPCKEFDFRQKLAKYEEIEYANKQDTVFNVRLEKLQKKIHTEVKCLILDFSALSYIDPSGANFMKGLAEDFKKIDIPIYVAGASSPIYEMLEKCKLLQEKKKVIRCFPSVHDAVECALSVFGDYNDSATIISSVSTISISRL